MRLDAAQGAAVELEPAHLHAVGDGESMRLPGEGASDRDDFAPRGEERDLVPEVPQVALAVFLLHSHDVLIGLQLPWAHRAAAMASVGQSLTCPQLELHPVHGGVQAAPDRRNGPAVVRVGLPLRSRPRHAARRRPAVSRVPRGQPRHVARRRAAPPRRRRRRLGVAAGGVGEGRGWIRPVGERGREKRRDFSWARLGRCRR
mmetsp:Transcript_46567/g.119700  ORF Transcript_46567/g.119700 Transcript_46567/m.119700 type:complete len:202 (-) Transcript_46567:88-693(-)